MSAVIATADRPTLLHACLESLIRQSANADLYEVLAIDNGVNVVKTTVDAFAGVRVSIRYFREPRRNASLARNRGWQAARASYVAFIDDDALASEDWIEQIILFARRRPDAAMFGGGYQSYTLEPPPAWFPHEWATSDHGSEERPLEPYKEYVSATNLVVRRDLYDTMRFRIDVGPSDGRFTYGEETRLQQDYYRSGGAVVWVPSLKVRHLLDKRKMTLRYMLGDEYIRGRSHIDAFGTRGLLRRYLRSLASASLRGLFGLVTLSRMPLKRRLYLLCAPIASECGRLAAWMGADASCDATTSSVK